MEETRTKSKVNVKNSPRPRNNPQIGNVLTKRRKLQTKTQSQTMEEEGKFGKGKDNKDETCGKY